MVIIMGLVCETELSNNSIRFIESLHKYNSNVYQKISRVEKIAPNFLMLINVDNILYLILKIIYIYIVF